MGRLFEQYHVEPVKGTDITIGNHFPEVFVSETDEVFCYLGICLNDESRKYTFMHPYYAATIAGMLRIMAKQLPTIMESSSRYKCKEMMHSAGVALY